MERSNNPENVKYLELNNGETESGDRKPGTKWTSEQLQAINARNCNLLVAAAAGAGKTAVLVERIIRKITDGTNPVDIDRMLIVTFTNAAAAEMRERIGEAITRELDKNPGSENMRRQLSLLSRANIMTIHSFCKEVITKHIEAAEIDPGFRIADEAESVLMRIEAMNEVMNEQYEEDRQDFIELLDWYGGNINDQRIQEMVIDIYNFIQSSPWPEKWLKESVEAFNVDETSDFARTLWGKVILRSCRVELENAGNMLQRAIEMLRNAEGLEQYIPVFEEDLSNIETLLSAVAKSEQGEKGGPSWDDLYEMVHRITFSRLPRAGKNADETKQETVKKIRDTVKNIINKKIMEKYISDNSSSIISDLRKAYPVMQCLGRLVREFTERYNEKKRVRSVLDFNDLEHLCLKILTEETGNGIVPSRIAMQYRDYFDEVMVDEYQDSNMVQELIIRMISRHDTDAPNVFMVGDVKQSIYRFRQARPEIFIEKYNTYLTDEGARNRKILLYKNFRSRSEIINAVNFVFGTIMSEDAGEIDYTEKEELNPGAVFGKCTAEDAKTGGFVEFHLIQTDEDENGSQTETHEKAGGDNVYEPANDEEITEIIDNIQSEARLIAGKILELTGCDNEGKSFYVFDKTKNEYRKAEFRDIVILLRATKNWAEVFTDELAAKGIPCFADTGTGFFKTTEIQVVLSLLQVIDNPLQDIPLLSVLRSPVFSFTTSELAAIRAADRKASIYDALKVMAEKHPLEEGSGSDRSAAEKAAMFLEKLAIWREKARHMPTDQLIWYLYHDTGYYDMVGAMPQGEQRQANLRILYDRARQFEKTSYKGLFNFINFIDKIKSSRGDMGSARILTENDNVVRIMSIHKSKGLEFPVVFVAGCGKKFNLTDASRSVLVHQELGLGPDIVDLRLRISHPSAAKIAISEKIRSETLSEEMRILYVAMTRAREKLIMTGCVGNIGKAVSKWAEISYGDGHKICGSNVLKCSSYADWIGAALVKKYPGFADEIKNKKIYTCGNDDDDPDTGNTNKWLIRVWDKKDMLSTGMRNEENEADFQQWLDEIAEKGEYTGYRKEIEERLSWDYPYMILGRIPAKVTVTELKRRFEAELFDEAGRIPIQLPVLVKKPSFLEKKKGLSPAEKGTVMHFVMQHLDFTNPDIKGQIEEMVKKDLLTEQQAETVDTEKIELFLKSELARRMLASGNVQREVPFNIEIPCHELYPELVDEKYRNENLLLQGIIDCYFEEKDGLVLVDYKTDYVPFGDTNVIIERYRIQIEYYARTLAVLTGKRVKERYIYLFSTGEIVEM
ncbi:ATP-dependent helicase/nuclease subunit A [Thermoclostridium stercorarium subsp. stercorarium DSM 8532]|uniref:ATP-dependent helicase/nuclease subunit A n=3 Tax=Thermoclostridium stercorarium TaxID=1510 RepID=L7VLT5_THES1|nr:ATP-dependent helicase/nuclease subunit A [Thermoclostridium stercorarium subsp. stercorarium DSM 8532]AGI40104.1 DNA helicase subunit A [Thermoclostridium stercorarium subsp. stercorarium DSM 8532]ANW99419.1 helicase-exonuclease AddAB subunit AddA [Thermoclostridium stercorarium subsp. thermolacticum DSM 2910]ANX02044.1 helicase-exonuclease AddAB subunit AddA [Thermoclostridium stercorarium subsp. leptospartum DSM 9219]